jgi:hypothetical protein
MNKYCDTTAKLSRCAEKFKLPNANIVGAESSPDITSMSVVIYLSMAGAKRHNDTSFILVPTVGRTFSRVALEVLYCAAPWNLQRGATSVAGEEGEPPGP